VDSLPRYQPSKVISEATGHFQLTSIDSVSKVARFYENALKNRGWRIALSAPVRTLGTPT